MASAPEVITGDCTSLDGALFHHVEPRCGSLPCPPYNPQKKIVQCATR